MKVLLTSAGITNQKIANALKQLVGKPPRKSKIAFIPTAANLEPGDKFWLIDNYVQLKNLGYEVDIVDISALPKSMWLPRLEAADALFFSGGFERYLLRWIKKSGLAKELPRLLKRRVYVGISAGSMVTAPRLLNIGDYYLESSIGPEATALGLVPFNFLPHLGSHYFPKAKANNFRKLFASTKQPIYVTDDQTAIVVRGNQVGTVGTGKHLFLGGVG